MRHGKRIKIHKQETVNTLILVVILCFFLYLGIQFSRNFSTTVSTQRTQTVTETHSIHLTGYVFKDETLLEKSTPGVTDYLTANGEKLSVGMPFAEFYAVPDGRDESIRQTQEEVNGLIDQIELLREGLSAGGTVSDLAHIDRTLSTSYYSYVDKVSNGDYSSADREGKLLLSALVDYTVITGRDGAAENIATLLEERKLALLENTGTAKETLICNQSCYFYREVDGYEGVFSSSRLENMTVSDLTELISAEPASYKSTVIGKLTHTPKWYLAIPTDEATCLKLTEGKIYPVSREGDGDSLPMTLERIHIEESGEAYLLFSSYDLTVSEEFFRAQGVKIRLDSLTGYRIPTEALTASNGEEGVYILVGNVVEFRRVTVIGEGNGYLIVNTYERDTEEGSVSTVPYLYVNDLIITSGNHLYDGMILN